MLAQLEPNLELVRKHIFDWKEPWEVVNRFEQQVAAYAGSRYAVSLDNCTDGMFLCLTLCRQWDPTQLGPVQKITIPKNTYCSVPMVICHAGFEVEFEDRTWSGIYQLDPYPIYDSATRFTKDMYISGSFQCLSFHHKKVLKVLKGGMILTDDEKAYNWFRGVRAAGRHPHEFVLYKDECITELGWNMYMTPELAAQGLLLLSELPEHNEDVGSSETYSDMSMQPVFSSNTTTGTR